MAATAPQPVTGGKSHAVSQPHAASQPHTTAGADINPHPHSPASSRVASRRRPPGQGHKHLTLPAPEHSPLGHRRPRTLTRWTDRPTAAPPPEREAPPLNKATRRERLHTLFSLDVTQALTFSYAHAIRAVLGARHRPRASPRPRLCANLRDMRELGLLFAPRGSTPHSSC